MKQRSTRAMKRRYTTRAIRYVAREILRQASAYDLSLSQLMNRIVLRLATPLRSEYMTTALVYDPKILVYHQGVPRVALVTKQNRKGVNILAKRATSRTSKEQNRLSTEEFTLRAIERLKNPKYQSDGIHAVYSGFNAAFREYFPGLDPVAEVAKLVEAGKVSIKPAKGGVIIYAGRVEGLTLTTAQGALRKMNLK